MLPKNRLTRIACFAHTFQLGIADGLQLATIMHALATGKRVVIHFSQSVLATDVQLKHQRRMGVTKSACYQTRWNSVFFMIKQMIQLHVNIIVLYTMKLSPSQQENVDDMVHIIPNVSFASYTELMRNLAPDVQNVPYARDLKIKIRQSLSMQKKTEFHYTIL